MTIFDSMSEQDQIEAVRFPKEFESSSVKDLAYVPQQNFGPDGDEGDPQMVLWAQFKGGSIYRYFDVPVDIWNQLILADQLGSTIGKMFSERVKKGNYRYEKVA